MPVDTEQSDPEFEGEGELQALLGADYCQAPGHPSEAGEQLPPTAVRTFAPLFLFVAGVTLGALIVCHPGTSIGSPEVDSKDRDHGFSASPDVAGTLNPDLVDVLRPDLKGGVQRNSMASKGSVALFGDDGGSAPPGATQGTIGGDMCRIDCTSKGVTKTCSDAMVELQRGPVGEPESEQVGAPSCPNAQSMLLNDCETCSACGDFCAAAPAISDEALLSAQKKCEEDPAGPGLPHVPARTCAEFKDKSIKLFGDNWKDVINSKLPHAWKNQVLASCPNTTGTCIMEEEAGKETPEEEDTAQKAVEEGPCDIRCKIHGLEMDCMHALENISVSSKGDEACEQKQEILTERFCEQCAACGDFCEGVLHDGQMTDAEKEADGIDKAAVDKAVKKCEDDNDYKGLPMVEADGCDEFMETMLDLFDASSWKEIEGIPTRWRNSVEMHCPKTAGLCQT